MRSHLTPAARSLATGVAVSLLFLGLASPAIGFHYDNIFKTGNTSHADCIDNGHSNGFCRTDNRTMSIFREAGFTTSGRTNIANTLNNSYANTVLDPTFPASPQYTGGTETDIIYQYAPGSVPGGFIGWAWCNDAVSDVLCDQGYAAFEFATPSQALACHETGHDVGLTHGENASPRVPNGSVSLHCMQSGSSPLTLGQHNVDWINAVY